MIYWRHMYYFTKIVFSYKLSQFYILFLAYLFERGGKRNILSTHSCLKFLQWSGLSCPKLSPTQDARDPKYQIPSTASQGTHQQGIGSEFETENPVEAFQFGIWSSQVTPAAAHSACPKSCALTQLRFFVMKPFLSICTSRHWSYYMNQKKMSLKLKQFNLKNYINLLGISLIFIYHIDLYCGSYDKWLHICFIICL